MEHDYLPFKAIVENEIVKFKNKCFVFFSLYTGHKLFLNYSSANNANEFLCCCTQHPHNKYALNLSQVGMAIYRWTSECYCILTASRKQITSCRIVGGGVYNKNSDAFDIVGVAKLFFLSSNSTTHWSVPMNLLPGRAQQLFSKLARDLFFYYFCC